MHFEAVEWFPWYLEIIEKNMSLILKEFGDASFQHVALA